MIKKNYLKQYEVHIAVECSFLHLQCQKRYVVHSHACSSWAYPQVSKYFGVHFGINIPCSIWSMQEKKRVIKK